MRSETLDGFCEFLHNFNRIFVRPNNARNLLFFSTGH